jgi:tRNA pseudouridine55 synthase
MTGIYAVSKPEGPTSNGALGAIRRTSRIKRAGHSGSLDPMATGVLVVALGVATRLLRYCVGWDKGYRARVFFGVVTDTDDITGVPLARCDASTITREVVEGHLSAFVGQIIQTPPRYSALKINGKRSYAKARAGDDFEVASRKVRVERVSLCDFGVREAEGESWCDLDVECGSGTYIRSIARDLGKALGVGGTLAGLHRYRVGPVNQDMAYALEDWDPSQALDLRHVFPSWSWRTLNEGSEWDRLRVGGTLPWRGEPEGRVGVVSQECSPGEFSLRAVYRSEGEALVPEMVLNPSPGGAGSR